MMMNLTIHFSKLMEVISARLPGSQSVKIERVFPVDDFQRIVSIERCRVNRNGGSFALIVFNLEKSQFKNHLLLKLAKGIQDRARISDQLGWYDHGRLALMLPETSARGAQTFIADLYTQNKNGMPKPLVDLYTYPLSKSKDKKR